MSDKRSLAEELQDSRYDEDAWEKEPVTVAVTARKTEVVSFRLPSEELDALEAAAAEAGQSISEYVRGALQLRMTGRASDVLPVIDLSAGIADGAFGSVWVVRPPSRGSSRTDGAEAPDFPPRAVAHL